MYQHRYLIVKRPQNYRGKDSDHLMRMYDYLPELRLLRQFCLEVYQLFNAEQVARLARRRRTLLLKKAAYQQVPELEQALGLLDKDKFDKMIAFLDSPAGQPHRTNNHVERTNRTLRFDEKVRYKFRSRRSLERFLCLRLERLNRQSRPVNVQADSKRRPAKASDPGRD